MAEYVFKLPDLGEGTVESEIVEWHVGPGDSVAAEAPLVDVMTDKATVEITAPVAGRVVSLGGEPGDVIRVGSELVVFDTRNGAADAEAPGSAAAVGREAPATEPSGGSSERVSRADKALASPATRRRARESDIDLREVPGSGPGGRITRQDLEAFVDEQETAPAASLRRAGRSEIQTTRLIGLRRKIAEKMQQAKRHIPHFGYVEEVDVTELEALRAHLNTDRDEDRPNLTYLPFLVLALVRVLEEFPQCNATYDDEQGLVTRHGAKHIGIATQTENGLVVPVVKHAETLGLWQCAMELRRVAEAARSGAAGKEELTGSTITVTSLGPLGGIATAPIINYPEVAIVGVNRTQERPVVREGAVTVRLMMNLSSAFDHRVVDGYDAARMIQALKARLEHPATIFIEEPP